MRHSKLCNWIKKSNALSKWDWVFFGILAFFSFISFAQQDLLVTGNRSWLIYDSGIRGFYDASYQWTGSYGANYMPTTFWLYAIWNYPLKLLGIDMPLTIDESRFLLVMWYKLLPVLLYMVSAYLLFMIGQQIGMDKNRAKFCMFSFITMPVAFFSQFIFSQYDIFTVFFMLLGVWFYFRDEDGKRTVNNQLLFCLSFGIAITCKYYAVLIFAVFLLMDEKRVSRLLLSVGVAAIPFFAEYMLYNKSELFHENVFGFFVLDYVSLADFTTRIGTANFSKILCVFLVIWAYFQYSEDRMAKVRWLIFFSCGICFCLFGLMTFHPQWLIFAVPFWVLSAMLSEHTEKYYWINIVFIAVLYLFVVQVWSGNVDDMVLHNGILKFLIADRNMAFHVADVLPRIDINTLYSIIIAIVLAFFVFSHPKYTRKNLMDENGSAHAWLIRAQLAATVVLWTVPCVLAILKDIQIFG